MNERSWHDIVLQDGDLVLRPVVETDWEHIYRWCNDPEVLYFTDGPGTEGYSMGAIKNDIFKVGSKNRFCFMMEAKGDIIGECRLQKMNLPRILEILPSRDSRRVDLSIGEKEYWGKGYGSKAIALLTDLGFSQEKADFIFGCGIGENNPRSLKAFLKNGYTIHAKNQEPDFGVEYDVSMSRDTYLKQKK